MFDAFLQFLLHTAFLWAPVLLAIIFWRVWISYVRADFISAMQGGWELLEIKIPRDVAKSPQAMEIVLQALHQHGSGHWYDRWWKGRVTHWFSLEIVSVEGSIYFFIRTQKGYRPIVEAQIYSQYPQAEISIVDDYTRYMEKYTRSNEWSMFGGEFELTKDDAYPIKTYVDYGLDKASSMDEEQKIDPITVMLEQMGSLRPGEQLWLQMIVKKHESKITRGGKPLKAGEFAAAGKALIEKLMKKEDKEFNPLRLTRSEQNVIEAVERNLAKQAFDVGMRGIYLAQKDAFNPSRIAMLLGLFRQFGSNDLNGFKPTRLTGTDYPWQDSFKTKVETMKEHLFRAYVDRGFFYEPYNHGRVPFVLTTEELATLFHFPGRVSETPTFARIEAKKSEPPANLPI